MRQRRAGGVGDDLLDDGVVAVLAFGLQYLERAGDEDGVVAPGVEQRALPGGGVRVEALTRRTINRPVTWNFFARPVNAT